MIFKGKVFEVVSDHMHQHDLVKVRFDGGAEFWFKPDPKELERYRGMPEVSLLLEPEMGVEIIMAKAQRFEELHTPEIEDFMVAVQREAVHQRERWGTQHDGGKTAADWFWLIGYLAGKALHCAIAGNLNKLQHHIITTAAACLNWHGAVTGNYTAMRPGIAPPTE